VRWLPQAPTGDAVHIYRFALLHSLLPSYTYIYTYIYIYIQSPLTLPQGYVRPQQNSIPRDSPPRDYVNSMYTQFPSHTTSSTGNITGQRRIWQEPTAKQPPSATYLLYIDPIHFLGGLFFEVANVASVCLGQACSRTSVPGIQASRHQGIHAIAHIS
jgi:hypothetical protein